MDTADSDGTTTQVGEGLKSSITRLLTGGRKLTEAVDVNDYEQNMYPQLAKEEPESNSMNGCQPPSVPDSDSRGGGESRGGALSPPTQDMDDVVFVGIG